MGVEYSHYIIPSDPTFVPQKDVIIKVDNLLQKWKLKANEPVIYNLTNGENTAVESNLKDVEFNHGILLEYDCEGISGKVVRDIMGDSYYGNEIGDDDRYIQNIYFIVGTDYRIHNEYQAFDVSLVKPPYESNTPLEPYCDSDDLFGLHAEAYTSSLNASPPEVEISVSELNRNMWIGNQNFLGYYRTALIIDCGKDLPNIENYTTKTYYKLENATFIKELEQALGITVVQVGVAG